MEGDREGDATQGEKGRQVRGEKEVGQGREEVGVDREVDLSLGYQVSLVTTHNT